MNRIIYTNETGGVSIVVPAQSVGLALKDVPEGVAYEIVSTDDIPSDRFFRNAWVKGSGKVDIDLPKAKEIGHQARRQKRAEEFAPYDEVISKQILGNNAAQAEAARQAIRDKYATMQAAIDAAATPDEIKAALEVTP
jgi:hypothetical protein